jgi:DNA-binding NtrC family response regulator
MNEKSSKVSDTENKISKKNFGANIRLLLVDDEKVFVETLSNRLARRGFIVSKAFTGSEGIQLLRRNDYDVAIVDLKMQEMDGIEVLKIFKKMDPQLMVIMLTGHGSETAARQGIEYGAFDYLSKPCELEDLLNKIKKAYEARSI